MNDNSERDGPAAAAEESSGAGTSRVFGSVERRRQLLRALAAGGALGGAGVPLTAHATGRPYCRKAGGGSTNYHPTASAVGSMIGSVVGGQPPVYGHNCAHWRNSGNWPGTCTNGRGRTLSYNLCANPTAGTKLRFYLAFEFASTPSTGAPTYRYCADILHTYPTSDEAVWLTAMLNANKLATTFPYGPSNIIDLYNSKNPQLGGIVQAGLNARALELFRDYLSQAS
jgi:hypothetical protein